MTDKKPELLSDNISVNVLAFWIKSIDTHIQRKSSLCFFIYEMSVIPICIGILLFTNFVFGLSDRAFIFMFLAAIVTHSGIFGFLGSDFFHNLLVKAHAAVNTPRIKETKVIIPARYRLLRLSGTLFSAKTQKEVFEPIAADWDIEIYESLKKSKDAKLFIINLRNAYGFIMAMWQKSPIGDLLELVKKIIT